MQRLTVVNSEKLIVLPLRAPESTQPRDIGAAIGLHAPPYALAILEAPYKKFESPIMSISKISLFLPISENKMLLKFA